MNRTGLFFAITTIALAAGIASPAVAQWDADAEAGASMSTGGSVSTTSSSGGASSRGSSDMRLAIQGRLDAFNMFGLSDAFVLGGEGALGAYAPTATVGLRMDRLFLGLGLGLFGGSVSTCEDDGCDEESSRSNSGFALSPMATFDLLSEDAAALHLGGWINLGSIGGGTFESPDGTEISGDGYFLWGLNLAAGIRGIIGDGLSIGSEFGWGFLTWSEGDSDGDESVFTHGLFGTILFEASIGL